MSINSVQLKKIRDELQRIIFRNGEAGRSGKLKKTQDFLRRNAETSGGSENQKPLKREEAVCLALFAREEDLFYNGAILEEAFISAGAEQRVYYFDDCHVIKLNDGIFYESWLDYFNNFLVHNYFFRSTAYEFLGFRIINDTLYAVVKQEFIVSDEITDLENVRTFLEYNGFHNTRNNDYYNPELGLIFEDLHDENVLSVNGIFYFIYTVFYLTERFYPSNPAS